MGFSLCEMCRKPLSKGKLCPSCILKKQEIQRYADAHLGAGPIELSKEFEVEQNLLQKWVRTGNIRCMTECRLCGHLIQEGELCSRCKTEVATGRRENLKIKYAGKIRSRNRKG